MTREEAIEILQALKFIVDFENYSDRVEIAIGMGIEALEEQRPQWIPVTERLPEDNSEVAIVIKRISSGAIFTDIGHYCERRNKWSFVHSFGSYFDYEILAWTPLPEPYKREGDKK